MTTVTSILKTVKLAGDLEQTGRSRLTKYPQHRAQIR
jgi:hypothetical protein